MIENWYIRKYSGAKTSHNKYKIEITFSIFSDHDGLKVEINRKSRKFTNLEIR